MGLPGTSVLAAAATYAGLQVRGTLRELRGRLLPWETSAVLEQEIVLDTISMAQVPRMFDESGRMAVAEETLELAERIMTRFTETPPVSGTLDADLCDDALLGHEEAATLILGLQDRATRDRVAEWMEGDEAGPALRLWRALARRCVGPYGEHAAAPLTLVGWVAWSTGDEIEAREALAMALGADPDYLFARLLHQACNEGLDPESIRRCLRAERETRRGSARSRAGGTGAAPEAEALTQPLDEATTHRETDATASPSVPGDLSAESSSPSPDASPRRRRRTRSGARSDSRPRPSGTGGRPSEKDELCDRARPAVGSRPSAPRKGGTRPRPPWKDSAQPRPSGRENARGHGARSEGVRPGGDASEGTP